MKYNKTFTFSPNTTHAIRKLTVKAKKGGETISEFIINQAPAPLKEFKWEDGTTAVTIDTDYDGTRVEEGYTITGYNLSDLSVVCNVDDCSGRLDSSNVFIGTLSKNEELDTRTIVFQIIYNNSSIAKLTVEQGGKPEEKYFYFGTEGSATTYETPSLETTTISVDVTYRTNYEVSDLLSATSESWIKGISFDSSESEIKTLVITIDANEGYSDRSGVVEVKYGIMLLGKITVKQNGNVKQFSWEHDTIVTGTSTGIITAEGYEFYKHYYVSGYTNLTAEKPSGVNWLSVSINTMFVCTVDANTQTQYRSALVKIKSNGDEIGSILVEQAAGEAKYLYFNTADSATTIDIPNFDYDASYTSESPFEVSIYTNYSKDELNCAIGGFISTAVISDIENKQGTVFITFGENTGIVLRTGIVKINGTLATINLKQNGNEPKFFRWVKPDISTSTLHEDVDATATTLTIDYETNYESLDVVVGADGTSLVINECIPTTITSGTGQLTLNFDVNVSTISTKNETIHIFNVNSEVGTLYFKQLVKEETLDIFRWVINGVELDSEYTVPGEVSKDGLEFSYEFKTNVEISFKLKNNEQISWFNDFTTEPKIDGDKLYCHETLLANNDSARTIVILAIKNGTNEIIGKLNITQAGAPVVPFIYFDNGQSGVTYEAPYTGGTKTYSLSTNYSVTQVNALRITKTALEGTLDTTWITDESISKSEGLKFTLSRNDDKFHTRDAIISVLNSDNVVLLTVVVNQEENGERTFKWLTGNVTADSATTIESISGDSEQGIDVTALFDTDYPNLNPQIDEQYRTWITTASVTTTAVNYHLAVNTEYNQRTADKAIKLYSNTKLIGTISIRQEAAPEPGKYLYLCYDEIETDGNLTISGIPSTLTEESRHFVVTASTNIDASAFTFNADSEWITSISKTNVDESGFTIEFNVANNTGDERTGNISINKNGGLFRVITLQQNEMTYEFSWEQSTIVSGKTIGPLGTGSTTDTIPFYSTYPSLTIVTASTQGGITCVMNGTTAVTYNTQARGPQDYSQISGTFNLKSGNKIVGEIKIEQNGQVSPLLFNWDNNRDGKEVTVGGVGTNWNESCTAVPTDYVLYIFPDENNPNGCTPSRQTYISLSSTGRGSVTFQPYTYDTETSDPRVFKFYVKGETGGTVTYDSPTYGTYQITQTPKPYFYWGTGTDTATTETLQYTGTSTTGTEIAFRTNYTGLIVSSNTSTQQYTSVSIDGNKLVVIAGENQEISSKSQIFFIKKDNTEVGKIEIKQNGKPAYFEWRDATGQDKSNYSIPNQSVAGGTYSTQYDSNYLDVTLVTAGTPTTFITSPSINTTSKTFSCTITSNDEIQTRSHTFVVCGRTRTTGSYSQIGTITVNQSSATPRFKWVSSQQANASGSTSDAGISWSTEYYYDTNYSGITCSVNSDPNNLVSTATTSTSYGNGYFHILTEINETQNKKNCIVDIKSNGSTLGQFAFEQAAPSPNFSWGSSSGPSSTAITVSSSNIGSKSYYTNYTGLTITFSSGDNLIQASALTSSSFSVTASTNPTTSQRSGVYKVKGKWNGQESEIGEITIKQAGEDAWFHWDNGTTAKTVETNAQAGEALILTGITTNESNPTSTFTLEKVTVSGQINNIQSIDWVNDTTINCVLKPFTIDITSKATVKKGTKTVAELTVKQKLS